MKTIRITFYNWIPNITAKERVESLLKNFYWQKGQEPEDWNYFDGDIEVKSEQSRGGDCATLKVTEKWAQWTHDHLSEQKDVWYLEILYTKESLDFVKKNRSEYEFDTSHQMSQINSFV